jgi:oligopeptide/dipeptide ABC transporter ATP-binding protein
MALLFISHNLAVVSRLCDKIGVMYAGSLVEFADKQTLFNKPLHPYTIGLLEAFPRPDARDEALKTIPGTICDLLDPPTGCKFHTRCFRAKEICKDKPPRLERQLGGNAVACYFPGG